MNLDYESIFKEPRKSLMMLENMIMRKLKMFVLKKIKEWTYMLRRSLKYKTMGRADISNKNKTVDD